MAVLANWSGVYGVRDRLADLLDLPLNELQVEQEVRLAHGRQADAVIHTPGHRFVVEVKRSATAARILGMMAPGQRWSSAARGETMEAWRLGRQSGGDRQSDGKEEE